MSIQHASNIYPVVWEYNLSSQSKDYAPRSPSVSRETLEYPCPNFLFVVFSFRSAQQNSRAHTPPTVNCSKSSEEQSQVNQVLPFLDSIVRSSFMGKRNPKATKIAVATEKSQKENRSQQRPAASKAASPALPTGIENQSQVYQPFSKLFLISRDIHLAS